MKIYKDRDHQGLASLIASGAEHIYVVVSVTEDRRFPDRTEVLPYLCTTEDDIHSLVVECVKEWLDSEDPILDDTTGMTGTWEWKERDIETGGYYRVEITELSAKLTVHDRYGELKTKISYYGCSL